MKRIKYLIVMIALIGCDKTEEVTPENNSYCIYTRRVSTNGQQAGQKSLYDLEKCLSTTDYYGGLNGFETMNCDCPKTTTF